MKERTSLQILWTLKELEGEGWPGWNQCPCGEANRVQEETSVLWQWPGGKWCPAWRENQEIDLWWYLQGHLGTDTILDFNKSREDLPAGSGGTLEAHPSVRSKSLPEIAAAWHPHISFLNYTSMSPIPLLSWADRGSTQGRAGLSKPKEEEAGCCGEVRILPHFSCPNSIGWEERSQGQLYLWDWSKLGPQMKTELNSNHAGGTSVSVHLNPAHPSRLWTVGEARAGLKQGWAQAGAAQEL